ncbi:hypothetical protein AAVH_22880 [Aphelenchoides avenae]|nr:hypothetical protein AAVH_22880 [Aphelenchus avenae]
MSAHCGHLESESDLESVLESVLEDGLEDGLEVGLGLEVATMRGHVLEDGLMDSRTRGGLEVCGAHS